MRFPAGVPARILVTDLFGATTTWLAKTQLQAAVNANLNAPWQITADVRSGDQAVNTLFTDGDPVIAQNNRLMFVFLREAPPAMSPWVCRASGILMGLEDATDADISTTHLTAYDPWQYLKGVPVFNDNAGGRIPAIGLTFTAGAFPDGAAQIAATILTQSIQSLIALGYDGPGGALVDMPLNDVGGGGGPYVTSGHYTGGGIHPTPAITYTVQQGMYVGDVWDQLCAGGQDASGSALGCDIVLEPIYDPIFRPAYTSQLAIYPRAGVCRYAAPMSWGRFGRSATTADRVHDGTPGSFVNIALFGAGQAGTDGIATIQVNAASVTKYYSYWAEQFFPNQPIVGAVENLAISAVNLAKQGKRTFALDPDPLRSPMPFRDYLPGDRVPVYTPGVTTPNGPSQRVAATGFQRIETIPLQINSDGVTVVSKLLCSPDYRGDTSPCT